ncbi:MAG TPA: ATP phosphoribosyltransferase regulatory subunit [Methylomusa anaerophila]|uniref:ATP phosphoribosyltransferase regulatory subunit n=1 Tax=Methylomusa anaerophila TaxID=1930071 RepID=A0A348AMQ3_9FIRM|nr:ATP phosphoribosyltransferase regulatory subunit [Methylomusa anaerophila]BBB92351.1 ATP phosphoribosyltransferase regulatory subunit [Methylomusa anaerophila]HML90010.1 ATP phosphoribosyltransferase regulatory subunit [Methylomusa anaerophila]
MNRDQYVPQIPYGTRDLLPREAKQKRTVENSLADLFTKWGYEEVITPTFEYLQTLSIGAGDEMLQHVFKFFDKNNRILVLRPDMTTPLARVAATRLKETPPPVRLFYLTNVFRHELAQAGRQCEFYQAGVELLGASDPAADAEVVALAVNAMLESGLANFQISLGQVEFINGIMAESGLEAEYRHKVKHCMVTRDLVGLGEILSQCGLSTGTQKLLQRIPLLHGRNDMLDQAYHLVQNDLSRQALDNLADIRRLLTGYGVDQYVNFDLGIIRDLDYYTGMVFEAYTPGLGFPLCGGGRYDKMVAAFGIECPATGFALGIERVLLALERQGININIKAKDVYIAWKQGLLSKAIATAQEQRGLGRIAELALGPQTRDQAEVAQRERGYRELIYIE